MKYFCVNVYKWSHLSFETKRDHTHIHYLLSVEMEELLPLLSKVNTSIMVWIAAPLKASGPPIFPSRPWLTQLSLWVRPFPSACTPPPVPPPARVPRRYHPAFCSLSPVLHLFIPLQWVFYWCHCSCCFQRQQACFPDAKCRGYLLNSCYLAPKQQYKLWTHLNISFFLRHLSLLVPVTPNSTVSF